MDIVAGLRMIDRLLAVGIGGMSIYLGHRLFLALPAIRDASGEFHLPFDIRVILWRVGPGAFFALFGTAVVALVTLRKRALRRRRTSCNRACRHRISRGDAILRRPRQRAHHRRQGRGATNRC